MQYTLLVDDFSNNFTESVNKMLSEGWELFGTPFERTRLGGYAQALIKKEPVVIKTKWMERFEVEHNPMTDEAKLYYKANNGKRYKIDPEKLARDIEAKEQSNG